MEIIDLAPKTNGNACFLSGFIVSRAAKPSPHVSPKLRRSFMTILKDVKKSFVREHIFEAIIFDILI